uniref:Uncharacterized protein n=1 Tax=Timema douglasi TaxID=61478 RepID=A0A7R8ZBB0_TIMDO|nr:unnamed protein product [Timema douglasi]
MSLLNADDIPIQIPKDEAGGEVKNLMSITEEQEEPPAGEKLTPRGSSLRGTGLPKLSNFPGLGKKNKAVVKNGGLERKESGSGDAKKAIVSQSNTKDASKSLTNRGSILSMTLGAEPSVAEVDGPALSTKKKGVVENSNGLQSLDSVTVNGSTSSVAMMEMERGSLRSESLTTASDLSGPSDTQSLFTSYSSDMLTSDDCRKLSDNPGSVNHNNGLDIETQPSVQRKKATFEKGREECEDNTTPLGNPLA